MNTISHKVTFSEIPKKKKHLYTEELNCIVHTQDGDV